MEAGAALGRQDFLDRHLESFMSVAQEIPAKDEKNTPEPTRRNGRWSGYSHLLMARMLELKREPEVVFWVFIFPLLLALGLGIAFRNKPAMPCPLRSCTGPTQSAQSLLARSPQHDFSRLRYWIRMRLARDSAWASSISSSNRLQRRICLPLRSRAA